MNIWFTLLYQPLVNALIVFYNIFGNFGLAIIGLTAAIRTLLIPLTAPSLKIGQKMKELAPELAKLKKKFGKDKPALAKAQMALYKQHGVNPTAGCLPQIIQIIILIALFQAFSKVLRSDGDIIANLNEVLYPSLQLAKDTVINAKFFYLDLTKPDLISLPFKIGIGNIGIDKIPGIFLIAAAAIQFLSSKLMMPSVKTEEKIAKKTETKSDDMATMMQSQMLYLMPLMTLIIGFTFPSGLVLYWLTFSLFMLIQQMLLKKGKNAGQKNRTSKKN